MFRRGTGRFPLRSSTVQIGDGAVPAPSVGGLRAEDVGRGRLAVRSFGGGISDVGYALVAAVGDAKFSGNNVVGNDRAADIFAEFNLGFVFLEFTATNQDRAALDLKGGPAFFLVVPLHKSAIAEPNGPFPGYFCDLVAWSPERAIDKAHAAGVCWGDAD